MKTLTVYNKINNIMILVLLKLFHSGVVITDAFFAKYTRTVRDTLRHTLCLFAVVAGDLFVLES